MLAITPIKADVGSKRKAEELCKQGFVGPAMSPIQELEYSAFGTSLAGLDAEFELKSIPAPSIEKQYTFST